MLVIGLLTVVLFLLALAWWRESRAEHLEIARADKPGYCFVCGFHRLAQMHGYVPRAMKPRSHPCPEEKRAA